MTTIGLPATASAGFTKRDDIVSALDRHHVPHKNWGERTPYGLGHLIESLGTEQMTLKEIDGRLLLEVQSVKVIPQHIFKAELLELYESHWVWPRNNGIRIDRGFRGVSKTKPRDKSALDTAHMALASEPGFSEEKFRNPSNYKLIRVEPEQSRLVQQSDKWTGLDAKYHWDVFHCEITEDLFKEAGYFQIRWGMQTHYVWKAV